MKEKKFSLNSHNINICLPGTECYLCIICYLVLYSIFSQEFMPSEVRFFVLQIQLRPIAIIMRV